ncbi:hypothetical protein FRC08_005765 [Ceratobasidium sp. 394]|nr:hypothetical protein FRC08_005765 [Ceratobasidium sp. 394]
MADRGPKCVSCTERSARSACNRARPTCSYCAKRGWDCVYPAPNPAQPIGGNDGNPGPGPVGQDRPDQGREPDRRPDQEIPANPAQRPDQARGDRPPEREITQQERIAQLMEDDAFREAVAAQIQVEMAARGVARADNRERAHTPDYIRERGRSPHRGRTRSLSPPIRRHSPRDRHGDDYRRHRDRPDNRRDRSLSPRRGDRSARDRYDRTDYYRRRSSRDTRRDSPRRSRSRSRSRSSDRYHSRRDYHDTSYEHTRASHAKRTLHRPDRAKITVLDSTISVIPPIIEKIMREGWDIYFALTLLDPEFLKRKDAAHYAKTVIGLSSSTKSTEKMAELHASATRVKNEEEMSPTEWKYAWDNLMSLIEKYFPQPTVLAWRQHWVNVWSHADG